MSGEQGYGKYVAFCGIVKSGKGTQIGLLEGDLKEKYPGREVVMVIEPGGTDIANALRKLVQGTYFGEEMNLVTEALIYAAARAQSVPALVRPVLKRGGIVLSDRCYVDSLAIQGFGRGGPLNLIGEVNYAAIGATRPDKVLVLDLELRKALARGLDPAEDKFEGFGVEFWERVRGGYKFLAEKEPGLITIVDAEGTKEEVRLRVSQALLGVV